MISEYICKEVALRLELPLKGVKATIELLDEGATVPFISRYRKERTGSFDEVAVRSVESMLKTVRELVARKEFVEEAIRESGGMTPDIARRLSEASSAQKWKISMLLSNPRSELEQLLRERKGLRLWQKL